MKAEKAPQNCIGNFKIRKADTTKQLHEAISVDVIERIVPRETVEAVIAEAGVKEERERKLNAWLVILVVIGMNIYSQLPIEGVLAKIMKGVVLLSTKPLAKLISILIGSALWVPCGFSKTLSSNFRSPARLATLHSSSASLLTSLISVFLPVVIASTRALSNVPSCASNANAVPTVLRPSRRVLSKRPSILSKRYCLM